MFFFCVLGNRLRKSATFTTVNYSKFDAIWFDDQQGEAEMKLYSTIYNLISRVDGFTDVSWVQMYQKRLWRFV
jgi:hypothetical protein